MALFTRMLLGMQGFLLHLFWLRRFFWFNHERSAHDPVELFATHAQLVGWLHKMISLQQLCH